MARDRRQWDHNTTHAAFRGQHIPTLEQVLRRFGSRTRLLVEIKTREGASGAERHLQLARGVAGLIGKMKLEERTYILSFDRNVLAACVDEAPRVRPVLNLKPPRRLGARLRDELSRLHALSADVRTLSRSFGAEVREAGRPLFVYTCNTPRSVRRATAAGATGVMSDRPAWLADRLARGRDEA